MATYPVIAAGQRITTAMLSGLTWDYAIKTASQTVTNSATLVNDTELSFPIVATAMYEWELFLRFSGLQAAGIRLSWSAPAGTTFNRNVGGPGSTNAVQADANTTEMRWAVHGHATDTGYTNPRNAQGAHTWIHENAIFTAGATSGTLQLRWAQLTANATGTIVQPSSYIRYRRIG